MSFMQGAKCIIKINSSGNNSWKNLCTSCVFSTTFLGLDFLCLCSLCWPLLLFRNAVCLQGNIWKSLGPKKGWHLTLVCREIKRNLQRAVSVKDNCFQLFLFQGFDTAELLWVTSASSQSLIHSPNAFFHFKGGKKGGGKIIVSRLYLPDPPFWVDLGDTET